MKCFWKDKELARVEEILLNLCLEAHAQSALRQNISTSVLSQSAFGSLDYTKSLIAALSTVGGIHAPLLETWNVLQAPIGDIEKVIDAGGKIPGWGSSFEKGKPDEIWTPVETHLREHFTAITDRIDAITHLLQSKGKNLFVNASCLTAATGIALGIPPQLLPYLFIRGRLDNWSVIFYNSMMSTRKEKN